MQWNSDALLTDEVPTCKRNLWYWLSIQQSLLACIDLKKTVLVRCAEGGMMSGYSDTPRQCCSELGFPIFKPSPPKIGESIRLTVLNEVWDPLLWILPIHVVGVNASQRPCVCSYFGGGRVEGMGVGVGWGHNVRRFDFNYMVSSFAIRHICHATLLDVLLRFHTYVMPHCWTFSCTSTHMSCYAAGRSVALPHIRHATLLDFLLHFHTYGMLHCWTFSCTSAHTSCYAAGRSVALPHICHATLLDVVLHFHAYVMLHCWMFCCASTHPSCYAAGVLLHFHTSVMRHCWTFCCTSTHTSCYAAGRSVALPYICHATLLDVALPHIRHATLLDVLLRCHTYVMLGCWTLSCTSTRASCYTAGRSLALPHFRHARLLDTHTSCYAAGHSVAIPHIRHAMLLDVLLRFHIYACYAAGRSLALPHIRHATLLDVLLLFHTYVMLSTLLDILLHFHTYVMLHCWTFS